MTSLDDDWGLIVSEIKLADETPNNAFAVTPQIWQTKSFILFDENKIKLYVRRPRGNPDYPEMGIFAQRNKNRPNQIGLSTVELKWHKGRSIGVSMLDAINGTPALDIKPVY